MKIITAADSKLFPLLKICVSMCRRIGHEPVVYDINGENKFGIPFTPPDQYKGYKFGDWPERVRGKLPYKPFIIRQALMELKEPVLWIDSDALTINPIEIEFNFDVGITARRPEERNSNAWPVQYGYLNAGVMFFNYTPESLAFIDRWIEVVSETESNSDQEAVTKLLLTSNPMNGDTEFVCSGARVKLFTTYEFNWYYFPDVPHGTTKIVHLKTDKRDMGLKWLSEWRKENVRTIMIQSASGRYEPLQLETMRWHAEYCRRHKITYQCHFGKITSRNAMWDRMPLIQNAMKLGFELVIWMDTDALITNPRIDLRDTLYEFNHVGMCRHPWPWKGQDGHYNAGVAYYRNTPETIKFLHRVWLSKAQHHDTWKVQASMLTVNDDMNIIERIDDRWNSTKDTNECANPVVEAWHGKGVRCVPKILQRLRQVSSVS